MIPRLVSAISSRLPTSLSFAFLASSSNPSAAQAQKINVEDFVESTITNNKVAVFSKSYCPYCERVKSLFRDQFPAVEIAVFELDERDDGSDIQNYLHQKTGQRTVPSVFIGTQHIGGSDDTFAAFKAGKLAALIKA